VHPAAYPVSATVQPAFPPVYRTPLAPAPLSAYIHHAASSWRKTMLSFLVWLVLLLLCWPIALLALVLYPVVWLLLLPFRLLGIGVDAVFNLLRAIVMLPARVLGHNPVR
jgi:hypothetical protein